MTSPARMPRLLSLYQDYLVDQNTARFVERVGKHYTIGTLERLATWPAAQVRRAAVFALGLMADYESNAVLGRALSDSDRGVRLAAENGIRSLWCRFGSQGQRQLLQIIIQLNTSGQFKEAIRCASVLIEEVPRFAEAWNQRAIACYSLGLYRQAIADCRQALELNPYHFGAAAGMGQSYVQLGDYHQALECFRRALRLNPNLEGVRANIQHLQRTLGEKS